MKIEAVSGINLTGKLLKNSGLQLSMNETVSFNNVFMAMQQMNQKQIDDSAIDRNSSKFLNLETNENSMTNGFDILNENVSQFELKNDNQSDNMSQKDLASSKDDVLKNKSANDNNSSKELLKENSSAKNLVNSEAKNEKAEKMFVETV
ncbi:MAG TPA: hypothetical protein PLJ38_08310, partial [bacterium]|nr:hypothetical protein [bacterium]